MFWEWCFFFSSIVGSFAILDSIVPKKQKNDIACFIFGFHNFNLSGLELNLSDSVVAMFLDGYRPKLIRLYAFSVVSNVLLWVLLTLFLPVVSGNMSLGQSAAFVSVMFDNSIAYIFGVFLAVGAVGLPADYVNFLVTKFIFQRPVFRHHPIVGLALDAVLTIGTFLIVLVIFSRFLALGEDFLVLASPFLLGLISAVFYFGVKILILLVSFAARGCILATKLNSRLVLFSDVHEHPFLFLGLVVGVLAVGFGLLD
ncbi:MAG: hypothetical protein KF887_16920 [Paracoccaceae bacterium]|nr:MAG: hypothetical protein KF887_16920 [Paracoccaceae bacterium]